MLMSAGPRMRRRQGGCRPHCPSHHPPQGCPGRREAAGEGDEGVAGVDDLDRATALVRVEGGLNYTSWLEVREAALGVVAAGDLGELGRDETGCDRGDAHACAAQLLGEGLREAEHERLAGRVGGEVRHRLEGHLRGDVDDPALAARKQRRQQPAGERDDRVHVQAHELAPEPHRRRREGAVSRDAGVVDEELDFESRRPREWLVHPDGGRGSAINGLSRPPLDPTSAARARSRSSRRATASTKCPRSLSASSRPRPDEAPVTTAQQDPGRCAIESDRVSFSRVVVALIDAPESGTARLRPAIISP
jgi:hypothetical protein